MLTQEQLADRRNFIGGSDASIICGFNQYKNRVQLWLEKTGQAEIEDISGKPIIEFGNYMEDGVAQWFQDKTGKLLHPKEDIKLIHPNHSWMAANLDRRLVNENAALECKTSGRPGEEWGDCENIIPVIYKMQCAHYCEVGNFDRIYICVVFAFTREFRWYVYERDQEIQNKLIMIESNFWFNHIVPNIAPEPSTKDEVISLYKQLDSEPIIASDEIIENIWALKKTKEQIKALEKREHDQVDQIAAFMGKHEILIDGSGKPIVTWKFSKEISRFNAEKFKKDNYDLYSQYVKISAGSRRFEIKIK